MTDTARASSPNGPEAVVVIGNGMVGHRFCEKLVELDPERRHRIVTFCEEPRPAYDRVGLTRFFDERDAAHLMLTSPEWYAEKGIELHVGDRATAIDREAGVVRSARGREIPYDRVVLATGSAPFVPPIPGVDKRGVFATAPSRTWRRSSPTPRASRAPPSSAGGSSGSRRPRPPTISASRRTWSSSCPA